MSKLCMQFQGAKDMRMALMLAYAAVQAATGTLDASGVRVGHEDGAVLISTPTIDFRVCLPPGEAATLAVRILQECVALNEEANDE